MMANQKERDVTNLITISIHPLTNGLMGNFKNESTYYGNMQELVDTIVLSENNRLIKDLDLSKDFNLSLALNQNQLHDIPNDEYLKLVLAESKVDSDHEFGDSVSADLKVSVTESNCYTREKLKKINFKQLRIDNNISMSRAADIAGMTYQVMRNIEEAERKGTATYQMPKTRARLTVLAKYYEITSNVRFNISDKYHLLKEKVKVIRKEMEAESKDGGDVLVPASKFKDYANRIKEALKDL